MFFLCLALKERWALKKLECGMCKAIISPGAQGRSVSAPNEARCTQRWRGIA